jgi:hypothetical protein
MTSLRYLILVSLYIGGHFFTLLSDDNKIIHNPTFVLCIITFLFFLFVKFQENSECNTNNNKLPVKYIFSQSIAYTILAVFSQYIYKFFLEKDCIDTIASQINDFNNITYIPEALFIAGFILLINNLSLVLIYPKCN